MRKGTPKFWAPSKTRTQPHTTAHNRTQPNTTVHGCIQLYAFCVHSECGYLRCVRSCAIMCGCVRVLLGAKFCENTHYVVKSGRNKGTNYGCEGVTTVLLYNLRKPPIKKFSTSLPRIFTEIRMAHSGENSKIIS